MATSRQIDANRRNALKSTGPVSDPGKARSRCNALKHGLAGSGVVVPAAEREAVEQRVAEWHGSLKPFDPYETWLLELIAVETVRVERCRAQERASREFAMRRASESWDDDRRIEAEWWASRLGVDPSSVARLRSTAAGAARLLDLWRALLRALDAGGWTPPQEALALDLLGTPAALRQGVASPLEPEPGTSVAAHRRSVATSEIAALERLANGTLAAQDDEDRARAEMGLPNLNDTHVTRLHVYESRCLRRLMWATRQMQSLHRNVTHAPIDRTFEPPRTAPRPTPEPEPRPDPEPLRRADPPVARPEPPPKRAGASRRRPTAPGPLAGMTTPLREALGARLYDRMAEARAPSRNHGSGAAPDASKPARKGRVGPG